MILLDLIEALPVDEPAQAYAREWASRVRKLHERQTELKEKALDAFDAGDDDACMSAVAEHDKVSAELKALCERQQSVLSRMRTSTDTMQ